MTLFFWLEAISEMFESQTAFWLINLINVALIDFHLAEFHFVRAFPFR